MEQTSQFPHSRAAYERSVLADIAAGVRYAANPARAACVDDAVLAVVQREFKTAVANFGLNETAACIERLISSNPGAPHSQNFAAGVRAEFARAIEHRVAA